MYKKRDDKRDNERDDERDTRIKGRSWKDDKDPQRGRDDSDEDRDNRNRGKDERKPRNGRDKPDPAKDTFSNCDVKGTKRYNCIECPCDGFWWGASSLPDTKCVLCGHMPAAHGTSPNTKPVPTPAQTSSAPKKPLQKTTNLDRNRKPRLKCTCGDCPGFERFENGSDCVNCQCIAEHHPMKEYGKCKDVSCNCEDYTNDVKLGQFDCTCGHKIARHEKLSAPEPKAFVLDPTSAMMTKTSGPKKCVCGKDAYVDKKTGQVFDKCGKSCTGVPVSSSNPSGKTQLCQKCNKRPVYPGSQFCGNTCRLAK
eukprot:TRINITY_DN6779_c0_g1_i3.p1 TRINITY_DN6779_c0_g1~~TRINITY_DN6779_c0_g1_i3.p1  ORF type:complete len:309 (+),score=72.41 TRINITY_DN6779_c0_g1_i3:192-1118(+)